jgi:hypothetical protein
MTKGRVVLPGREVTEQKPFFDRSAQDCGLPIPRHLLRATTALPFVISTGAKRSGEICGLAVPSWKCFSTDPHTSQVNSTVLCQDFFGSEGQAAGYRDEFVAGSNALRTETLLEDAADSGD